MSEHTPGPWRIDEVEDLPLAVIQDDEDGTRICDVGWSHTKKADASGEQVANARLIAAAPELYDAAILALQWFNAAPIEELDAVSKAITEDPPMRQLMEALLKAGCTAEKG
jgi:hypothetical protein